MLFTLPLSVCANGHRTSGSLVILILTIPGYMLDDRFHNRS